MKLSKIIHKNEVRIKIQFTYNQYIASKIKESGAIWSKTLQAWHMPCTIEAIQQLARSFPEIQWDTVENTAFPSSKELKGLEYVPFVPESKSKKKYADVYIDVIGLKIWIKLPKMKLTLNFYSLCGTVDGIKQNTNGWFLIIRVIWT